MAREVIKFGAERARGGKKRENTKGFLGSLPPLPPLFLYSLSLSLFPGSCPHGWRAFVFCSFLGYNANALDLLPPVSPDSPVRSFSISLLPEDRRILCVARYTVSGVDGVYISRVFRVSYPYRFLSSRFLSQRYVAVSPPAPSTRLFVFLQSLCVHVGRCCRLPSLLLMLMPMLMLLSSLLLLLLPLPLSPPMDKGASV